MEEEGQWRRGEGSVTGRGTCRRVAQRGTAGQREAPLTGLDGGPVVRHGAVHGLALQAAMGGGERGRPSGGRRVPFAPDSRLHRMRWRRHRGVHRAQPARLTWEKTRSTSTSGPSRYSSIRHAAPRPLDCGRGTEQQRAEPAAAVSGASRRRALNRRQSLPPTSSHRAD